MSVHVEVVFDPTHSAGGDEGCRCPVLVNRVGAQGNIIRKNLRETVDWIHVAHGKAPSGYIKCCKAL